MQAVAESLCAVPLLGGLVLALVLAGCSKAAAESRPDTRDVPTTATAATTTPEPPLFPIEGFTADQLDSPRDELDDILSGLDSSLTEEEGEILNG